MAADWVAKLLGEWEGFEVVDVEQQPIGAQQPVAELMVHLRAVPGHPKQCSRCGEVVTEIHDVTERRVRDLWVFDYDTWIVFPRSRLQCPRCGPTVEPMPWFDKHHRMTKRLAEKIARLAMVLPLAQIATWFRVQLETGKQLHHRALEA